MRITVPVPSMEAMLKQLARANTAATRRYGLIGGLVAVTLAVLVYAFMFLRRMAQKQEAQVEVTGNLADALSGMVDVVEDHIRAPDTQGEFYSALIHDIGEIHGAVVPKPNQVKRRYTRAQLVLAIILAVVMTLVALDFAHAINLFGRRTLNVAIEPIGLPDLKFDQGGNLAESWQHFGIVIEPREDLQPGDRIEYSIRDNDTLEVKEAYHPREGDQSSFNRPWANDPGKVSTYALRARIVDANSDIISDSGWVPFRICERLKPCQQP